MIIFRSIIALNIVLLISSLCIGTLFLIIAIGRLYRENEERDEEIRRKVMMKYK